MAANKIYVSELSWSTRRVVMHAYDDINVAAVSPVHIGLQMGEPTTNCNRIDFFTICSRYVPHITYEKSN